jgi:multicomponent K+:H+ antiporter subunit D
MRPRPVAALFAIMTKVGAYAILRVHTTAFGPGIPGTEDLAATWLFPAAIVTIAVGAFGVLGARRLMPLIAFSVVGSMGTLLVAVAAFSTTATSAALYYMVHSTFAAACLFLIADLVITRRSADTLRAEPADGAERPVRGALLRRRHRHGGDAAAERVPGQAPRPRCLARAGVIGWAWSAILIGSLLTIVGFARAGSALFWKSTAIPCPNPIRTRTVAVTPPPATAAQVAPVMLTLAVLALLAVFAGPVSAYLDDTSAQLFDRDGYVDAVLAPAEED